MKWTERFPKMSLQLFEPLASQNGCTNCLDCSDSVHSWVPRNTVLEKAAMQDDSQINFQNDGF